jgi:DmsE family decaheme c-type cytochrome
MKRCTVPRLVALVPVLLGVATLLAVTTAWAAAGYVGTETCLGCHDEVGARMANSVHGRLADYQYPTDVQGCESCHGPGEHHADSEDPTLISVPQAGMGEAANGACLVCHQTGVTLDWETASHAMGDVACVSCHAIHSGGLLVESQETLCFSCHQDKKASMSMPSHHPLKEGFMACSDCHNVHGDNFTGLMTGETSRELCLGCHTQHRGPFLFEHSPVEEDCMICHDPHGAVANHLLVQNEPFLCLQCHQPHFHTALMSAEGEFDIPSRMWDTETYGDDVASEGYEGWSLESHADSFKQSMLTKCSQCHMSVHGTDLPSQSIPGQGRALNR